MPCLFLEHKPSNSCLGRGQSQRRQVGGAVKKGSRIAHLGEPDSRHYRRAIHGGQFQLIIWQRFQIYSIFLLLQGDEICGAVCSVRNQEDTVSLWNKTADDAGIVNRIRNTMHRVLNLPPSTIIEYTRHDDCLKSVLI